MAGLFSNRFTKTGPGVSKDAPQKNRFFHYFELLGRKFGDICKLNVVFLLSVMPLLLLSVVLFVLLWQTSFSILDNLLMSILIILSPWMLAGPSIGAATKIAREFSREIPVFVWSDFWATFRSDWKQTLALSVLDYLALCCVTAALPFYFYSDFGYLSYVLFAICFVIALIVLFMQNYLYVMSVSFDLSLSAVIKNSFVLAALCIGRNLIAALVTVGLVVLSLLLVWYGLVVTEYLWILLTVLVVGILFGFYFFTINYLTFPALKKYIIDPYYEEHPQETSSALESAELEDEEKPEYVYHNGRMVHRSVLEQEVIFQDAPPDSKPEEDHSGDRK